MAKDRLYLMWQMDVKADREKEIQRVLEYCIKKYGKPPELLEYSKKLEKIKTDQIEVKQVSIPENIFLLGL